MSWWDPVGTICDKIDVVAAILTKRLKMLQDEVIVLTDAVAAQKTVIDSAVALMNGLHEKLDAAVAANDMAKVSEIVDALKANTDALAAAVAANTDMIPVVDPAPVDPAPVDPAPVDPAPVDPPVA